MKEQEKDNIYIYSEEKDSEYTQDGNFDNSAEESDHGPDDSSPNYAQSNNYEEGSEKDDGSAKQPSPLQLMFKVMFNPIEGWKEVRRDRLSPESVQSGCFYPLLALLALSKFASLIYSPTATLTSDLVAGMVAFVSFFFGYFCILLTLRVIMPAGARESLSNDFAKVFVMICLSTLSLFFTVLELLPMLETLLIFLPLWTVYIICRGARFFKFPDNHQIWCTAKLSIVIVGMPILIAWALVEILPKQI